MINHVQFFESSCFGICLGYLGTIWNWSRLINPVIRLYDSLTNIRVVLISGLVEL